MAAGKEGAGVDRRVARTRKTLQQALMRLMLEKGYDAVTVEDICIEADVGRSTFYAHFTGKEDLKRSGLDDHLRKMLIERHKQARAQRLEGRFAFALLVFQHARDHIDLYRALVSKGGTATTLASILKGLRAFDHRRIEGTRLGLADVLGVLNRLGSMEPEERARVPGMDPERVDTVVPGAVILAVGMKVLDARETAITTRGLRHGLLIEAFGMTKSV